MESLPDRLRSRSVKTADSKYFVPDKYLEEVVSDEVIDSVLSGDKFAPNFQKRREVTELITKNGKKTLVILVLIGMAEEIFKFVQNDQLQGLDSKLPLEKAKAAEILGDDNAGERFYEAQWQFLAPFLRKDRSHRRFGHEDTILPFIQRRKLDAGGFGDIFMVTLHPFHQRLVDTDAEGNVKYFQSRSIPVRCSTYTAKATVVQKVIRSTSQPSTENEEERILASLRSLKHPNIIALLTSYSIGNVHNLIFPVAQGNLASLLRGEMECPPNLRLPHAILRETHGLSSAIDMVHTFFVGDYGLNLIGCHHDLKPKNILVKDGKFLLTDFGLSRLDPADDWKERQLKRLQGFYTAPECESIRDGFKKSDIGTPSDIWSFGCILAEIITFLLLGSDAVKEFEKKRETTIHIPIYKSNYKTSTFHSDGEPNQGVEDWLTALEHDSQSDVERGVLRLVRDILKLKPIERPKIKQVVDALFFLAQKSLFEFSDARVRALLYQLSLPSSNTSNVDPEIQSNADLEIQSNVDLEIQSNSDLEIQSNADPKTQSNVDLEIQSNRYRIWGRTVGLTREFPGIDEVRSAKILQSRSLQFQISDVLREIEDEIHFLHSWHEHSLGPTYLQFQFLNDRLWSFLPSDLVAQMEGTLQNNMLDAKTPEDLLKITDTLHSSGSAEYTSISSRAELKYMASRVGSGAENDEMILQSSDISAESAFGMHFLSTLRNAQDHPECPVLIEQIVYKPSVANELAPRVRKICRLFSTRIDAENSGLRVLRCKGYYQDGKKDEELLKYRLVYEIPQKPTTLRDYIKPQTDRNKRPDLGDLFDLATKIVRCVLEVHKIGWIHKSISSYNIVFFEGASKAISVRSPYLIGFNYSREDAWQTFTSGLSDRKLVVDLQLYQHPQYLNKQRGYKPEYDFYSVGVVLLEIGRWRTVSQIAKGAKKPLLPSTIVSIMLDEAKNNLGNSMGALYRDAVIACLASDFVLDRGRDEMRNDFEEKVLNRLARCRV